MGRKKRSKQPLTREQKDAQAEIDKEDGQWYRDLSKFVATGILITSIFEGIPNKWIAYPLGLFAVVVSYRQGTRHFNNYKKNKDNGIDTNIQSDHTDGDHRHDQTQPQGAGRERNRRRIDEATTSNGKEVTDGNDSRKQHGSIHGRRRHGRKRKK